MEKMNLSPNYSSCTEMVDSAYFVRPEFFISVFLFSLMTLTVIFGNLLVVLAVSSTKKLRTLTGYLILSLAMADLMVGLSVLPFSTINVVLDTWLFGTAWCQVWLVLDVWMCTASIYNLVAISIDRYIAITKPLLHSIILTPCRGRILIASAWIFSFLICFPPMVAQWPSIFATDSATMLDFGCQCTPMNNSPGYILYSAFGSFYLPMCAILYVYYQIYKTVRSSSMARQQGFVNVRCKGEATPLRVHIGGRFSASSAPATSQADFGMKNSNGSFSRYQEPDASPTLGFLNGRCKEATLLDTLPVRKSQSVEIGRSRGGHRSRRRSSSLTYYTGPRSPKLRTLMTLLNCKKGGHSTRPNECTDLGMAALAIAPGIVRMSLAETLSTLPFTSLLKTKKRTSLVSYHKKLTAEIRAAKTVAIVTGCFLCCWLGFCIIYTLRALPFCRDGCIPDTLFSVFFWLGYANSSVNPLIYAVFQREFRVAFLNLLRCRKYATAVCRKDPSL